MIINFAENIINLFLTKSKISFSQLITNQNKVKENEVKNQICLLKVVSHLLWTDSKRTESVVITTDRTAHRTSCYFRVVSFRYQCKIPVLSNNTKQTEIFLQ